MDRLDVSVERVQLGLEGLLLADQHQLAGLGGGRRESGGREGEDMDLRREDAGLGRGGGEGGDGRSTSRQTIII